MNNLKTNIKPGTDLTSEELDVINFWRKKEFNKDPWSHDGINYFHKNLFFIVRDESSIVSFGMLLPVEIIIDQVKYNISGIATIFSTVRGKGYGKYLMEKMKEYLSENNQIGIGSCGHHNTEFYRKCGFEIWENGVEHFIYIDDQGKEHPDEDGDTFYLDNDKDLMSNAQKENKFIYHYFPHW